MWRVDWRRLGRDSHGHSSRIAFTTICSSTAADIGSPPRDGLVSGCGGSDHALARSDQDLAVWSGKGTRELAMPKPVRASRGDASLCWGWGVEDRGETEASSPVQLNRRRSFETCRLPCQTGLLYFKSSFLLPRQVYVSHGLKAKTVCLNKCICCAKLFDSATSPPSHPTPNSKTGYIIP